MDFLAFFGGVWASIAVGLFIIAMSIGCAFDRHNSEAPKWYIFLIGTILLLVIYWGDLKNYGLGTIFSTFAKYFLVYLVIGVIYSIFEFLLAIRKSTRFWKETYSSYRRQHAEASAADFMTKYGRLERYSTDHSHKKLILIKLSANEQTLEPRVNRVELAEAIGCWTFFWPFYAISLIVGDLLTEMFQTLADLIAKLSGRLIQAAFRDTFRG